ncbi:UNVERIFIED_CONTAM: E3 ubiquitin-protein ligase MBR2 [Sesamum calycinum]|uniref:RING-type E3 ubiquitin transferase n=1 Tax=Sesamum calycinum TaxID=2727403 RepID=A0AAW2SXS4_9LAMI
MSLMQEIMYYSQELHSAASSGRFPPPQGGGPPPYFLAGEFPSILTPPYFNGLLPPLHGMMRPLQRELTDGRFDAYYANRAAAMAIPSRNYGRRTHTVHPHQIMNVPAWRRRYGYVQVQEIRNDLPILEPAAALGRNWIQVDETMILDTETEWGRENVEREGGLSEKLILKYLKTRKNSGEVNSSDGEPKICIVCQEDLWEENGMMTGVLDCRHEYHASCIRQWLQQKNICPLCKTIALPVV